MDRLDPLPRNLRRRRRLRRGSGFLVAGAAVSLTLHATLIGGSWWAWEALPGLLADRVSFVTLKIPNHPAPVVPPEDPLGVRQGLGDAISDFEAEDPLQSDAEGQNQPLLGVAADGPLREGEPTPSRMLAATERELTLPSSLSAAALASALRSAEGPPTAPPVSTSEEAEPIAPNMTAELPAETDPGPADGREVDLFAQEASTEIRPGGAEARAGRDHRIRGLRRTLTAFLDSMLLPRPIRVRFLITVDREGTPTLIEVVDTSGSQDLDLAIRRELFNSWFDPDPSGDGTDLGRPFHFAIRIH